MQDGPGVHTGFFPGEGGGEGLGMYRGGEGGWGGVGDVHVNACKGCMHASVYPLGFEDFKKILDNI